MKKFNIVIISLFIITGALCTGCDMKFNTQKQPPQSYEEWQKKNDPNYKPEKKSFLPTFKPKAKKVPQTYEEWLKQNR